MFVDVAPGTYSIAPAKLDAAYRRAVKARRGGRSTPRAIIAVDLFGQPADYPALAAVARKHGLKLIADSAQGFRLHALGGRHPL